MPYILVGFGGLIGSITRVKLGEVIKKKKVKVFSQLERFS